MYNSKTKATMKAATTRSMMNGRRSHQELMKSQSVIVELNPSSDDMGEIWQSLACLLTSRPASESDNGATRQETALKGGGETQNSEDGLFRGYAISHKCVPVS